MADLEEKDEYSEIIDSHNEKSEKLEKKADNAAIVDERDESSEGIPTITEEFAKKHGLPNSFVGKPFDELGKSYNEIKKFDTRLSQDNKKLFKTVEKLEEKFGEFEKQLSQKEVKEIKKEVVEEVEDKMPEMPDPYDKPAEFKAWLEKRDALFEKKLQKEVFKALEDKNAGLAKSVQAMENERMQQTLYDSVANGLQEIYGDDADSELVEEVLGEYEEYLKENKNFEKDYYGKPNLLARDALWYHKVNAKPPEKRTEKEDEESEAEKKAKLVEETHKKQLEKLKKTNKTYSQTASSARDNTLKDGDEYSEIIKELEQGLR